MPIMGSLVPVMMTRGIRDQIGLLRTKCRSSDPLMPGKDMPAVGRVDAAVTDRLDRFGGGFGHGLVVLDDQDGRGRVSRPPAIGPHTRIMATP
jgi:hypothetical protein